VLDDLAVMSNTAIRHRINVDANKTVILGEIGKHRLEQMTMQ